MLPVFRRHLPALSRANDFRFALLVLGCAVTRSNPLRMNTESPPPKIEKEKVTIRLRVETIEQLGATATRLGRSLPGLIADAAEALRGVPAEKFHRALAAVVEEGRRL